jgi:hypothetical protein
VCNFNPSASWTCLHSTYTARVVDSTFPQLLHVLLSSNSAIFCLVWSTAFLDCSRAEEETSLAALKAFLNMVTDNWKMNVRRLTA